MLFAGGGWRGHGLTSSVGQDSHGRVGRDVSTLIENCEINHVRRTVKTNKNKNSLTLRAGFSDRLCCSLVLGGRDAALFPLWAKIPMVESGGT